MIQHLAAADASRGVKVRVGDEIVVELPGLGGAGYEWHPISLPPELEVTEGAGTGGIGGGVATIRVRVLAPFRGQLQLQQYRRWEGIEASVNTFTMRFDADDE